MIGIIAACSKNGVIGVQDASGKWGIPFAYPEDMRHFKETTADSVVVMGRRTFESIGKPLPKRENIVITSTTSMPGAVCMPSVKSVIQREKIILRDRAKDIWFIGGHDIYKEAMQYADRIVLTITPDIIENKPCVEFPWINPNMFKLSGGHELQGDNGLLVLYYYKCDKFDDD